jgi:HAD superfamily hydrolase (TIGR01484 family)
MRDFAKNEKSRSPSMQKGQKISLVVADVDGTLVTEEKVLMRRAGHAVKALRDHGIRFAITSGRPPRGMAMLLDALEIDTPIAGFNGGLFVRPDLTILSEKTVPAEIANRAIDLIRRHDLDVWVYSCNDWLVAKPNAPHMAREAWTVKFEPKLVADVADHLEKVAKIVSVSDDLEKSGAARPTRAPRSEIV